MPLPSHCTAAALSLLVLATGGLLPGGATAQTIGPTGHAAFDSAYYAWERGDYPDALARLARLLDGPDAHRHLVPAALLTGELYATTELTTDGAAPRWAPDSRHVAWESGTGAARRTHIGRIENGGVREAAIVSGTGLRFDGAGRVLYISVPPTPEVTAARAALQQAVDARDNAAALRARTRLGELEAAAARVVIRSLDDGRETTLRTDGLVVQAVLTRPGDDATYVSALVAGAGTAAELYRLGAAAPQKVTTAPGPKSDFVWFGGAHLLYAIDRQNFAVQDLRSGAVETYRGTQPAVSADGSAVAFVRQDEGMNVIGVLRPGAAVVDAVRNGGPLAAPALSPDGRRLAWQAMPREDWEIYVADSDGSGTTRLTREIQHDLLPRFIDDSTVFAVMGEARHRRSYLYDTRTAQRTRLFHNNTVRTVAPEYEWLLSPDRTKLLIVAERDGDTVSPERGVYVLDLSRRVGLADIRERVRGQLAHETALRERGRALFAGLEPRVRAAVADVSTDRVYRYSHELYAFDSKFITQPGNARAIEYLTARLREFGYEPELQWFEARGARTANVIAVLPGTVHPDVLYTVSSHFDSVERGPGADDNTSGTAALLEAARVLAGRPQPATIHFAFFTGEEAGLLGSREYVRRAVEGGDLLVGALNNDMIGFANDQRLDNTIRYSNDGIRDIQHAAAFLFTDLITYDAKYYRSTDAHAYYEAYGDIVGGIGSYPILGNPHYHQTHDQLETINHQLVAEVAKTTVASLIQLTNVPSRPKIVGAEPVGAGPSAGEVLVRWEPLPERDVTGYLVRVIGADGAERASRTVAASAAPSARVPVRAGDVIEVWGVNVLGRSWDAARVRPDADR
jgi:hypothetical protein